MYDLPVDTQQKRRVLATSRKYLCPSVQGLSNEMRWGQWFALARGRKQRLYRVKEGRHHASKE